MNDISCGLVKTKIYLNTKNTNTVSNYTNVVYIYINSVADPEIVIEGAGAECQKRGPCFSDSK